MAVSAADENIMCMDVTTPHPTMRSTASNPEHP